jgi:MYXO-CTERM domain-containing protein
LVFSANPDLTGEQARMIVEKTADRVGGVFYDFGGHNDYYGYGRVNAARSTRAAQIGFGNPAAAICAENFNCVSGVCIKAAFTDPFGQCWVDCGELPDGAECYDDNKCTENDICSANNCAGSQISCDDENICTDDSCDPADGCIYTQNQSPCDDGNACTENDTCFGGSCTGSPLNCDDQNPCTDDYCDPESGCAHNYNQVPCDDGDTCTEGDRCSQGECVGGDDACEKGCGCAHGRGSFSWLALLGVALLVMRRGHQR